MPFQSPCVTFGQPEAQLKAHKAGMIKLSSIQHDAADRIAAMSLAQEYGRKLYTGVFYRDPEHKPTYEETVAGRHQALMPSAPPRTAILNAFSPRLNFMNP